MTTPFQKQVKTALAESQDIYPDKVICHKNGAVTVKRGYFYRHGMDGSKWATKVQAALAAANIKAEVSGRDNWQPWPKDSYFEAIVEEATQ